jgi:hypothetical protein
VLIDSGVHYRGYVARTGNNTVFSADYRKYIHCRLEIATSCVHSVMMIFSAQLAEGMGARLPPFTLSTPQLQLHGPFAGPLPSKTSEIYVATCTQISRLSPLLSGLHLAFQPFPHPFSFLRGDECTHRAR